MICISCGHEHDEKFCPNCGEKADNKTITLTSLIATSSKSLIEMDKGFLYNVKHLCISPKKMVIDYLNGKRKGVFNPISFLIITTTIYIILEGFSKSGFTIDVSPEIEKQKIYSLSYKTGAFIRKYFKFFWAFCIFPMAIVTNLFYRKYNFWEHLTISAFMFGQATLLGTVLLLITQIPLIFNPLVYIILTFFIYSIFSEKKHKGEDISKALTIMFLYGILLFIVILILSTTIKYI
ncbi:DUF3667 domain-containing protein [uncultured Tenacibaculum sp.]|uniref:DUF3667 domain-containing protein n=1 Tax=uncultured Tenacibaculum sp. TaxID=174713 RepID=UPI00261F1CE2|nr:DUF3667 domain-containing protein [uncultured Tenacibaculum sp.]